MSSITKGELIAAWEECPDDYEVLFEIREKKDGKSVKSIAYINGIDIDNEFKEIRLMN